MNIKYISHVILNDDHFLFVLRSILIMLPKESQNIRWAHYIRLGITADWLISLSVCTGKKKENISTMTTDGFKVGGGVERPLSRVSCPSQQF